MITLERFKELYTQNKYQKILYKFEDLEPQECKVYEYDERYPEYFFEIKSDESVKTS